VVARSERPPRDIRGVTDTEDFVTYTEDFVTDTEDFGPRQCSPRRGQPCSGKPKGLQEDGLFRVEELVWLAACWAVTTGATGEALEYPGHFA
jgi:hypothetical protein